MRDGSHAEEPIIDPDDPTDSRRLWSERPIMLALAERAIEQKLGVETSLTVYRKHFYELAGFKRIRNPNLNRSDAAKRLTRPRSRCQQEPSVVQRHRSIELRVMRQEMLSRLVAYTIPADIAAD
jgi:hypothetical protein